MRKPHLLGDNRNNGFEVLQFAIDQSESDLRPILLYILLAENTPGVELKIENINQKLIKFKQNHSPDKYYFVIMGYLEYFNHNYNSALFYFENTLQFLELFDDLLMFIVKDKIGEIFLHKKEFSKATKTFSNLIFDIESSFSKLNYSIIKQDKLYAIFDVFLAKIALKYIYSQVLNENYFFALKNAFVLLDNPIF